MARPVSPATAAKNSHEVGRLVEVLLVRSTQPEEPPVADSLLEVLVAEEMTTMVMTGVETMAEADVASAERELHLEIRTVQARTARTTEALTTAVAEGAGQAAIGSSRTVGRSSGSRRRNINNSGSRQETASCALQKRSG